MPWLFTFWITDGQQWHNRLPTLPARRVKVRVLNGAGIPGLAGQAAARLRKLGFDVVGVGDTTAPASTTTVTYSGTAQADSAYTLMTALKAAPAAQNLLPEPTPQTGVAGPVTLIIGSDWVGVARPTPPHPVGKAGHSKPQRPAATSPGGSGSVQARNAGASICSGLPAANPNPGGPP